MNALPFRSKIASSSATRASGSVEYGTISEPAEEIDLERAERARDKAQQMLNAQEHAEQQLRKAEVHLKRAISRIQVHGRAHR